MIAHCEKLTNFIYMITLKSPQTKNKWTHVIKSESTRRKFDTYIQLQWTFNAIKQIEKLYELNHWY